MRFDFYHCFLMVALYNLEQVLDLQLSHLVAISLTGLKGKMCFLFTTLIFVFVQTRFNN